MNTTTSCCEKCKPVGHPGKIGTPWCGKLGKCPCHSPQPPHEPQEGWETAFDRAYIAGELEIDVESKHNIPFKKLKSFIKQLLAADRAQTIEAERKRMYEGSEKLRRTDENQMSHDHTYDEAIDDCQSLIYPKETNEEKS